MEPTLTEGLRQQAAIFLAVVDRMRAAGLPPELLVTTSGVDVWMARAIMELAEGEYGFRFIGGESEGASYLLKHHKIRWAINGAPRYDVSDDLAASLILTDPSNVRIEEIKWPYDALLVRLPDLNPFVMLDRQKKLVPAQYLMAQRVDHLLRTEDGCGIQSGAVEQYSHILSTWPASRSELELMREEHSTRMGNVWLIAADCTVSFLRWRWDIGSNETLGQVIRDSWSLAKSVTSEERTALDLAVKFVANLFLYVTSHPPKMEELSPKLRKAWSKDPLRRGFSLFKVGSEIKLPHHLKEAARSYSKRKSDPLWKLASRHIVTGHWKLQRCGAKGTDRKRIWVEPYARGPEAARTLERLYSVERAS